MEFKQHSIEIKDLDDAKGIVTAFANVYNVVDSDGDISLPGSFTKTVAENSKRLRVLKDHNPTISLGVPLEINANDPYGLLTTTKFNMKKDVAKDMFTDILLAQENGLNSELSIGYNVQRRADDDKRKIAEYRLWEYSFLTSWAANELSTVTGVKGLKSHYGILEIITKAYDLPYSDGRLIEIENILKSLTDAPSDKPDTLKVEPTQITNIFANLKFS